MGNQKKSLAIGFPKIYASSLLSPIIEKELLMEAPFVLFFSTLLVIWYVHIIGVGHFILFFTVWSLMFSKTLESSGIHLKSIAYKTWPIWIQSHKNHMMQHSTQQLSFLLGHHEHLGLGILGAGSPSLASPLPFCTMFFINWFILF